MTMLEKQKQAEVAPQPVALPAPKRRRVWIGVAAAIVVGAVLAVVIALLVTSGASDEPAPEGVLETSVRQTTELVAEGYLPYASSIAVRNEFLAKQEAAQLPYASSVAAWNEFLAKQEAAQLPYASSVAAWDVFLAKQKAADSALPYASSVAAWDVFLAKQEAAEGLND